MAGPAATTLPAAVRFTLWFNAWAAGRASLDDARDGVVGEDAAHDVAGLPDSDETLPLVLALGRLRAGQGVAAGLALPVPGDPLGLAGPPAFNTEALEVGAAVLLTGTPLGLVPLRAGAGVVWHCRAATTRRQVPTVPEADTGLRQALLTAGETLTRLDVAGWRPEAAAALEALRHSDPVRVPPGADPRTARMLDLALRCRRVAALALDDDGGAVSVWEAARRREALTPLDAAARRALVAACEAAPG